MRNLMLVLLTVAAVAAICMAPFAPPAHSQQAGAGSVVAEIAIPTARGVNLAANIHRPAVSNGAVVVLAPGQGYHRDLPLMKRSAELFAEAGFTAVRFDWAYFTAKGQPADDLATEVADTDAAVAFAKKLAGVKHVFLAGKSLGSIVAAKWAVAHPKDLAGLALLTLPIHDPADPAMAAARAAPARAVPYEALVVCGDADPLAPRKELYAFCAAMERTPQLVVVPGDHGFNGPKKDEAEKLENVELAARALVVWAKRRLVE
jgi:predicted alpha/beta-hydrolase family hydrolase